MNQWQISAGIYSIWQGFSLKLDADLILSTGSIYHLKGANGSGKSSFISQVLIPQLLLQPDNQYIIYSEQLSSSQWNVLLSHALLTKQQHLLTNLDYMLPYQFHLTQECFARSPRPVLIIADEYPDIEVLLQLTTHLDRENTCLLLVTHREVELPTDTQYLHLTTESPGFVVLR